MLEPVLQKFPKAPVGVLGMKRGESTFRPSWYYENIPPLSGQSIVVILDPMLATGGSAETAVSHLLEHGAKSKNVYFLGIIGAPEGFARLAHFIPRKNIILASIDKGLDTKKYIVPGLGDFGDRYFGYSGKASLKKLSTK
jgi:uracil phosphoribosyltransferase